MTENIGLRLRFKSLYIVVTPTETAEFSIEITDAACKPPADDGEHLEALEHLQRQVDGLRAQTWQRIKMLRQALGR